jgi:hypothetical protein
MIATPLPHTLVKVLRCITLEGNRQNAMRWPTISGIQQETRPLCQQLSLPCPRPCDDQPIAA